MRTASYAPARISTPTASDGVGPGSYLLITQTALGGSQSFICTANFVWTDTAGNKYLGAAGHCFLPSPDATNPTGGGTLDPAEVAGGPAHGAQLAHDAVATAAPDAAPPIIHMPSPSYWPLLAALGLSLMATGLLAADSFGPVTIPIFAITGLLLLIGSIYGWSFESP